MSRVALIVGGASGIGAASARALAAAGRAVAVADVNQTGADQLAYGLPGEGHHGFAVDAGREDSIVTLFQAVEDRLGPIAVVVVAAGTSGFIDGKRPNIRTLPAESWDAVMALNARGPFLCIREMLRRRETARVENARIILIASMAAQMLAINSPPSYVASKGALLALTRVAAGEGASLGVTVNAVAPGAIDTPMLRGVMPRERDADYFSTTIAGRAGTAEEVAVAVAFLASAESAYITGTCIDVNGGMHMR